MTPIKTREGLRLARMVADVEGGTKARHGAGGARQSDQGEGLGVALVVLNMRNPVLANGRRPPAPRSPRSLLGYDEGAGGYRVWFPSAPSSPWPSLVLLEAGPCRLTVQSACRADTRALRWRSTVAAISAFLVRQPFIRDSWAMRLILLRLVMGTYMRRPSRIASGR